ncbi:hypothetical protein AeMF1_018860 [Aphanomyces euteiches]|nr:hypothetical protein AeMF1_018860 [Aphanomyces euteiches]
MATQGGLSDGRHGLEERLSYIHSANKEAEKDGYTDFKTPGELEDGAIVEGGALTIFSAEAMALFAQYAAIGCIYGLIPALQYPIFNNYLKLEGYQTASYTQLVTMGWSFKVFFGMLSDCFPIFGYRRKSWILIGWTITMVCLLIMISSSLGEPYCNVEKATAEGHPRPALPFTPRPTTPTRNISTSTLPTTARYCAADAMVVEYA